MGQDLSPALKGKLIKTWKRMAFRVFLTVGSLNAF